jgi:hypothetical protein
MPIQHYGKSLPRVLMFLLLCSPYVIFSQDPRTTPKPAPRKFDLQIEVRADNPAGMIEGAKVIVASEEAGVRFSKERRTNAQGMTRFSQVPQGKLKIQVVARDCDTFGDLFTLTQDEQTIKITVKKRNQQSGSSGQVW